MSEMDYEPVVYDNATRECGPALGTLLREMSSYMFSDFPQLHQLGSGECKPRDGYTTAWWVNVGDDHWWAGRFIINRKGHDLGTVRHQVTMERYIPGAHGDGPHLHTVEG